MDVGFFYTGHPTETGFQAPADGPADQAHPAADQVPPVAGGDPEVLPAGGPDGAGGGDLKGAPRHDGRPKPGQRHDGHRPVAGIRGNTQQLPTYKKVY